MTKLRASLAGLAMEFDNLADLAAWYEQLAHNSQVDQHRARRQAEKEYYRGKINAYLDVARLLRRIEEI